MSELKKKIFPKKKVCEAMRKAVEELPLDGGTAETIAELIEAQGHTVPASIIERGLKDIGDEFYMSDEELTFPKEKLRYAITKAVEKLGLNGGTAETVSEIIEETQGHTVPASVVERGLEDMGEEDFYIYEEGLNEEVETKYDPEERGW